MSHNQFVVATSDGWYSDGLGNYVPKLKYAFIGSLSWALCHQKIDQQYGEDCYIAAVSELPPDRDFGSFPPECPPELTRLSRLYETIAFSNHSKGLPMFG